MEAHGATAQWWVGSLLLIVLRLLISGENDNRTYDSRQTTEPTLEPIILDRHQRLKASESIHAFEEKKHLKHIGSRLKSTDDLPIEFNVGPLYHPLQLYITFVEIGFLIWPNIRLVQT